MTITNTTPTHLSNSLLSPVQSWLRQMWSFNWFVTFVLLLHVVAIPIYLVAAINDTRLITNAPAFIKPLKFVISIAIYLGTFLWLMTLAQRRRWWVHLLGNITALGLLIEIVLITGQAIRGVPSHYNLTTPFDEVVFGIMGVAIVFVSLMNLLLGIWLLFQRLPNSVIGWSLRFGVFIALVGMLLAFNMTGNPSPAQRAQLQADQRPNAFGAHSVGVDDGGPGLPFLGWSTEGGDLRVAHFIGLHGMQAVPLLALFLTRRRALSQRQQLALLVTGGVAYLAWTVLLTWQALRGQSIIAPDATTWLAYACLIGFVIVSALLTLTTRHQPAPATVRASH